MVTKHYLFFLRYKAGYAVASDWHSIESLRQALWRAHRIPEHRIEMETREDATDWREAGLAAARLEMLRAHFLANGIAEERLEVLRHAGAGDAPPFRDWARRGRIHLFPRVASLCPGVGEPFLTRHELAMLDTARRILLFHNEKLAEELAGRLAEIDWRRVVGHESLHDWAMAGAQHPLYDDDYDEA